MTWVRLDEEFPEHPKLAQVGPVGMALQVAALAYCNRNLTDGFVPFGIAETLIPFAVSDPDGRRWQLARTSGSTGEDLDARWTIGLLLGAGIWEDAAGGYQIHDFDQYQPPREAVLAEREASRERQRKARAKRDSNGSPAEVTAVSHRDSHRDTERSPGAAVAVAVTEPGSSTQDQKPRRGKRAERALSDEELVRRTALKDALVELCGWENQTMTRDSWGRVENAAKQLHEVNAEPDLMRGFADLFGRKYPGAPLTPQAFTNNWPDYMAGKLWPELRARR